MSSLSALREFFTAGIFPHPMVCDAGHRNRLRSSLRKAPDRRLWSDFALKIQIPMRVERLTGLPIFAASSAAWLIDLFPSGPDSLGFHIFVRSDR